MNDAKKKRRMLKWFVGLSLLYVSSYIVVSLCGRYQPSMTGESRWLGGLALMDREKWAPYGVTFEIYKGPSGSRKVRGGANLLGAIYSPAVLVDRALWHRTHTIGNMS